MLDFWIKISYQFAVYLFFQLWVPQGPWKTKKAREARIEPAKSKESTKMSGFQIFQKQMLRILFTSWKNDRTIDFPNENERESFDQVAKLFVWHEPKEKFNLTRWLAISSPWARSRRWLGGRQAQKSQKKETHFGCCRSKHLSTVKGCQSCGVFILRSCSTSSLPPSPLFLHFY